MTITYENDTRNRDLEPDLFKAAEKNDVETLRSALKAGQSLDRRHQRALGMTPIHLACIFGSNAFLKAAIEDGEFDPWLRDANGRVPFDHAWAKNNKEAMSLLFPLMHPDAPAL